MADDGAGFKDRGRGFKLDKHDGCSRDRNRRRRVHDNAQRAVVGIAGIGMQVGYLDDSHQRHHGQTRHGHPRQDALPGVAFPA